MLKENNGKLQFGLTIPQGWRGGDLDLEEENNPIKQFEFSKSIVITADKIGFDSLYAYDHLIPFFKDDIEKNIFECFTLLSATATITKRIKMGQIVTCNSYRNPALLAKMVSTLDVISKGRMELGIGAGWYEKEYLAYGYDFPSHIERIKQLDESLSIIKEMWIKKSASFEGNYYTIKEAVCNPKPIQKPHPTIMVGGSGEKYLLKVVAKHANRYNIFFGTPHEMKRKITILKDHCSKIGRDHKEIQYSVVLPCIITESGEAINQIVARYKRKDKTVEQCLDSLVGGITIGTPEKIINGLNQYIEIGVSHFIIQFKGLNNSILKLFRSQIINKI
ncbi:MAG: TIGR03560 family F420-dependent LLM class oxidoreductase [Nitrososphaeraceae archaeon]|nr:TIGR03560 family F420-dependent LLM class oxidoreductase [Nitrososphaeraceae archaeon]MDW0265485.1 TIGR03560 family F420-dependent LLM class oxidoreductase [Nitrososphaeraceae archaeon]